jgi:hypothetical protein
VLGAVDTHTLTQYLVPGVAPQLIPSGQGGNGASIPRHSCFPASLIQDWLQWFQMDARVFPAQFLEE